MTKTVTGALTSYFNTGEGKRPNTVWLAELKALSNEEKAELAQGVAEVTGWTIT
jgi:hypothetical protein